MGDGVADEDSRAAVRCGATIFPDNVEAGELKVNCRGKVGFRYADNINVVTGNKKFQFCLVGSKTADVDLEYFSHLRSATWTMMRMRG